MMKRLTGFLYALVLGAAGCTQPPALKTDHARPQRIVSLDYCADQFVLKLADRAQIAALSPDATKSFSYLADEAQGLAQVRAQAEDVLVLQPDLVVRSYGGGPGVTASFARAGVPVAQLQFVEDYAGIRANVRQMADAFGHPARGDALVSEFDRRLAAIDRPSSPPKALYMSSGGVTTGAGTLIDTMMKSAGLQNFFDKPGWNPLPLEQLAYERPDLVIAATFGPAGPGIDAWSSARHPVARGAAKDQAIAPLDGALTACGGWFVVEAIETMAKAAPRDHGR
jgi:iron complex transport system substrate-binding protein